MLCFLFFSHFWRFLDLPFPLPGWFLLLPGFLFGVPLRIGGSGFRIGFGCSVSRSGFAAACIQIQCNAIGPPSGV